MGGATIYLSRNEMIALICALANYANMVAYYPADNEEYEELSKQGLDRVSDKIYNKLKCVLWTEKKQPHT